MDGINFNNTGYAQNQTDRAYRYAPPVYSPFQNANNVDDAFGYLANMYGPMLVKGAAGPDAFLAHQMPGQALADQFAASRYQQQGARSVSTANALGNAQVATKLLGVQSLLNGGRPITQLDREHAQVGAQVVNNPLFKAFGASMVGPENLESIMFGSKGDPTAIAAATNRMGFFRSDAATGERKMSERSLEGFSRNVYQNLYGPDANVDEMHGFGAVAAGEMMEDLFQKGKLPQSLGNMSAAERVRTMSKSQRDDKTMNRLADEFAHNDLSERDYDYANATAEEQKIMRADKLGDYRSRLDKTFTEIDKFAAGDSRAKSAEEIQQLEGFGGAANAVDAQRTSKTIKEYNGALAAIREIFGDNGQSGAPIQQLMASLQQLTNGSQGGLSQGKVESTVRQMRLAARDTNTDINALTTMMYEDKAVGNQLGLQESTVEQGMAGRMLRGQAMADAGVFEQAGFGKLQRGEAEQRQRQMSLRGDASSVGRSLAVLNRLVSEDPEKYKGTKLEAAVKAYRSGQQTFTYNGESTNLAELAGRQGVAGVMNLARESGADNRTLYAYTRDKIGTEEYLKQGYTYNAQKYELQRNFSRANEGAIRDRMSSAEFEKLKPGGMSDKDFQTRKNDLSKGFSYAMTGIIMDETADMTSEQRFAHLEKRGKEELSKYFRSSRGGGMNAKAAEAEADKYFAAMYGKDAKERRSNLNAAYAEVSAVSADRTGVNIEANKQMYNQRAIDNATAQETVNTRRADRLKDATMGHESSFLQRVGDELDNLGSGNSGQAADALKRVFNVVSEDSILQKYAPDMQEGLVAVSKMDRGATTTREEVAKLTEQAAKEPDGAAAKTLKQLAGFKPDQQLTDEETASLGDRAMMRSAETAKGATDAEKTKNEATKRRASTMFKAFNTGKAEDVNAGARAMAEELLGAGADPKQIEAFAKAALNDDTTAFEKSMQGGVFGGGLSDEDQDRARGISRALRASKAMGGLGAAGLEQTPAAVESAQDRSTAKANELTREIRDRVETQIDKGLDQKSFDKLQPAGLDPAQKENQRKEFVRRASETVAGITVNEMGGAASMSPEERAEYMKKRTTEEFTKHFERKGMVPARAKEMAESHFGAAFGTDKETVTRRMNAVYDATKQAAEARGHDTEGGAFDAATIDPATGRTAYDYEKLGVTKSMTAEQKKLVDEIGKDQSGASMKRAMQDEKQRKLLLTIPDSAAVDLFGKFTPEAQQQGLEAIDGVLASGITQTYLGMDKKDVQNLSRLRDAVGSKAPGGISSQNVGGRSTMPQAAGELDAVTQEMAKLYDTKAKSGWFTSEKTFSEEADKIKYRDLSQRRMELESGDALSFVDTQISDVKSRGKSGWFTSDKTLSGEDQEQLDFLNKRRDSLTKDRRQGMDAVQAGRESITDSQQFSSMRGEQVVRQLDYTRDRGDPQMGGGGAGKEMTINGTLTLNGLSEAVMAASGRRMEETPDGGAPVDMAPGNTAYHGR